MEITESRRCSASARQHLGKLHVFKDTHPAVSEQLKEPLGKELSDSRAGLKGFPSFSLFLLQRIRAGRLEGGTGL